MKTLLAAVLWLTCCLPLSAQDIVTGLAAHYTFDANGNDSTANNRHLTTIGAPVHGAGKISNAVLGLGGKSQYRLDDADFLAGESSYSIAAWVKRGSRTGAPVFSIGNWGFESATIVCPFSTTSLPGHATGDRGDGAVVFVNGVARVKRTDAKPATGSWALVAWVVESATSAKLYVHDGATLYTATTACDCTLPASGNMLLLARDDNGGCDLDQLRIYTRALAEADVLALAAE